MTRRDKIAWGVFAAHVVAIWIWAEVVHKKTPQATASAALSSDGVRFGKSEEERRKIFAELTRGEPQDRAGVESRSDTAIWNRNRDSYFHEVERGRIPGVSARFRIPQWMGWWILDEGFHAHWPAAPGVTLYADDAPLAQATRPLTQKRMIVATPAEAPPPPPAAPTPAAPTPAAPAQPTPVKPAPSAPPTTAPRTSAPPTTAPPATAPRTTAPPTTAPPTAAPPATAPRTTAPPTTAPPASAPRGPSPGAPK